MHEVHERSLTGLSAPADFVFQYRRLQNWDLAPIVVEATDDVLVTECHPTLFAWWEAGPSQQALTEMRILLRARISELHSHGICHRDIHIKNVVLRDGTPLFIDTEFVIATDPNAPCYDLYGPDVSGIPAPEAHRAMNGADKHGVWWHAPVLHNTLGHLLGPLPEA